MLIEKFKELLISESITIGKPVTKEEITLFESKYNISLPKDMVNYFQIINGTNEEYDNNLFQFYSLNQFKNIDEELKNWTGIPDYSDIVNVLKDSKKYFVFADYSFHMFTYAIRLSNNKLEKNEVYVLCGDEYKKIANNFSEFIELYLIDSIELQLNKD